MSEALHRTRMIVRRLVRLLRDLGEIQCSPTQARRWLLEEAMRQLTDQEKQ